MIPVIALVGRPNVGKSTLFNRLTRSRDALVVDRPGVTRDRLYGRGTLNHQHFLIVDTGGIQPGEGPLQEHVSHQVEQVLSECSAVILLADRKEGPTGGDREIIDQLRKLKQPLVLAVNKCEGVDPELAASEFYALGVDKMHPISAKHGHGVSAMVQGLLEGLGVETEEPEEESHDIPKIAVIGKPNVGKSTLINVLAGEERVVVFDLPGTTRDSVRVPVTRDDQDYLLIDTAGVRRRTKVDDFLEKFSIVKSLQAIEEANVVILVFDARAGISDQDATLAGIVEESGRAIVVAINKWDNLEPYQRQEVRRELDRKVPFLTPYESFFISALHGSGVGDLLPAISRAYDSAMTEFSTGTLNRHFRKAVEAQAPPLHRGRSIKLKFVHQGGKNPPMVVVHGNQIDKLPATYKRYLANYIRKAYKLTGTRVRMEFRQSENPFNKKSNKNKRKNH